MQTYTREELLRNPSQSLEHWMAIKNDRFIQTTELMNYIPVIVSTVLEGYSINAQILSRRTIIELNTQILEKFKKEME